MLSGWSDSSIPAKRNPGRLHLHSHGVCCVAIAILAMDLLLLLRRLQEERQSHCQNERHVRAIEVERRVAPLPQRDLGLSVEQRISGPEEPYLRHLTIFINRRLQYHHALDVGF